MDIADLLSRLDGVKETQRWTWVARCPAHKDRHPSLTVKVLPDERILMHCFAGCETESVLSAIGVQFSDLFAKPLGHHFPKVRRPFTDRDALECLKNESFVLCLVGSQITDGKPVSGEDLARAFTASARITAALEVVHGY